MSSALSTQSRILLVDDDPAMTRLTADALAQAGYDVCAMTDLPSSCDRILELAPDLILLDVQLPPINGYTLCQQLKANHQTSDIPVIFISAQSQPFNNGKAFGVGGVDYLVKPFALPELLVRVQNQLAVRKLHRKLVEQHAQRLLHHRGNTPLLTSLQRQLHQQSEMLAEKNRQLQQEIQERQRAQDALKAEQEKSERLLLNILPRATVDRLKHEPGTVADRFDNVTILFADIVDFTPLSARLTPLELVELLNQIFSSFDQLAEFYGLEKIKTIGDAYMVAGGVPVPREDHAIAIMEMAIAMRRQIRQFTVDGKPIQLRIGINTGSVVAGVIGISKFSYDLWGDAVNIASRMESQGLAGKIQVTEATYEQLKDKYQFEKWGAVNVKGRGKMTTYLFAGRKPAQA